MGNLTLKELCDAAREELGWTKPAGYANTTDDDGQQTFRLANRQGREMADKNWEVLKTTDRLYLTEGQQSYPFPLDFRHLLYNTAWEDNTDRLVLGPLTPQEWAYNQNYGVVFGLNWRFEVSGGALVLDQAVTAADTGREINYRYISSYWAKNSGGTSILRFSADTDTQKLDDDLFIHGLIWRLKKAKGFDWEEDYQFYERELARIYARDGGMREVSFKQPESLMVNVPDGNYG